MSQSILLHLTVDEAYLLVCDLEWSINDRYALQSSLHDFLTLEHTALIGGLKVPPEYEDMTIYQRLQIINPK